MLPPKIANLSYLTYLNRYQKWQQRGCVGDVMDFMEGEDDEDESETESEDTLEERLPGGRDDSLKKTQQQEHHKNKHKTVRDKDGFFIQPAGSMVTMGGQGPPPGAGENINDFKKLLATQTNAIQSKEFLKNEIDRMINILRSKQEAGQGVHTFRRMEPGGQRSAQTITIGQEGRYEEVQFSVASLFAGRSAEVVDDESEKDEEAEK